MNDDFSQQLLDKIEHERVRPVPRWRVLVQRAVIWALAILGVSIAALLCSLLLIAFLDIDVEILRAARPGPALRFFVQYVPVMWIVLFIGFCFLIVSLLRRETHAYRYGRFLVLACVSLCVVCVGVLFHFARVAERAEPYVMRGIPPQARPWMMRGPVLPRPEDGVLMGQVIQVDEGFIVLRHAVTNEPWNVLWHHPIPHAPVFHTGQLVMARGVVIGPQTFEAEWIRIRMPPRRGPQGAR